MNKKGFTLIEILVVVSIIGILATIVIVSVGSARAKARDSKRISDLNQVQNAIWLYYDNNGAMPINRNPGFGYCDTQANFLQELVDNDYVAVTPKDPSSPSRSYCYYDYGAGNTIGALIVVSLEAAQDSTTGIQPSCRPWPSGINWCDQGNNKYYCLCNPY
ncbi:MAG: type II secretion system protein [Candidatus Portnoybacteria bacterium]|nr:type II secretion system protein [Candidatus Portnoybacteria bacterium]